MNIEDLTKDYTDSIGHIVHLLENINLSIGEGEFTTILAPTGAGKSTLVKIIAGLENLSSGKIENNSKKKIFIPSKPSSFPWLSVMENILFDIKDHDADELQDIINLVGLAGYEDHYPHDKSLGFRLRISLGRAIVNKADLIIIDEPFAKMRDEIKNGIYLLLRKIQHDRKISVVLSTSNISEAILLSDKVFLMDKNPGRILDSFVIQFVDPTRKIFNDSKDFTDYRERIKAYLTKINSNKILNISL